MSDPDPFAACPIGSRWQSKTAVPVVRVVRHTYGRDGRPSVILESESGAHSRNAWHPASLVRNRTRLDS